MDSLEYARGLIGILERRVAEVEAERDAAIADMEDIVKNVNVACRCCKNLSEKTKLLCDETMRESKCFNCECFSSWKWRGDRDEE